MNKTKMTRKNVMESSCYVVAVGYCDAQWLLQYKNPVGYTCGTYGWNCDVYDFGSITLTTGYRPFGTSVYWDLGINTREYEAKARKESTSAQDYNETRRKVNAILDDYIEAIWNALREKRDAE